MKAIAGLILFVGALGSACPVLQGHWLCKYSNGASSSTEISQSDILNGVLYHIASSQDQQRDFYADGNTRAQQNENMSYQITVSCIGDTAIQGKMDFTTTDGGAGHFDFKFALSELGALGGQQTYTTQAGVQTMKHICEREGI